MDAQLFAADVERKPTSLRRLADRLDAENPWSAVALSADPRVLLLGMGSSHYAAAVAAARLRARGVDAVAERASSDLLPRLGAGSVVVAVSAGGGSRETLDALARLRAGGSAQPLVVALTNTPGSALGEGADVVVEMAAGTEEGGVACLSFAHTLGLLLALETHLGGPSAEPSPVAGLLRRAAAATDHLLESSPVWLPTVTDLLAGPDGTHVVAPARRLSSAQQSALMLREGPRRPAVACETGDWSHVDVYLTKTTDYRMLLLAGSRWEPELLGWTASRDSTVVAVGADVSDAAYTLRYPGDQDDDVRLLAETTVAELVAARLWAEDPSRCPAAQPLRD